MKIVYRCNPTGGWHGNREIKCGKVARVKEGSPTEKKLRAAISYCSPSECDWIIPNLRDPYAIHSAD